MKIYFITTTTNIR